MSIVCVFWLFINGGSFTAWAATGNADLRVLLQNQVNQDLIKNLGTRYEIVHPVQIRQDWQKGLSTKVPSTDNKVSHLQKTSLLIDTHEYKLHLDLELNTNLFAPTLVQFVYSEEDLPVAIPDLPENCYYQATIRNHPDGAAAFYTCNGMRGIIMLDGKTFFLQPLYGNLSETHHHLLYHVSQEELLQCGNTEGIDGMTENLLHVPPNADVISREKFIEIALVFDQSLTKKYSSSQDAVASAIEIINYADMLLKPLNTSLSLVYSELWVNNQMELNHDISQTLHDFKDYVSRRISRISIDAAHLFSGMTFSDDKNGIAFLDSICTDNGVGLIKVNSIFHPHISANTLVHTIGHNIGMKHDQKSCTCSDNNSCIMSNQVPHYRSTLFSNCSIRDYFQTLYKGFGACLFNMPNLRMSVCGNGILEESEQCDCGTVEECIKINPCCDPVTCKLIKHAECSVGPCCKKCKLLSADHLCRPSRGECDIPEFCDGKMGKCPEDLFKRNGAICSEGLGYCFQGVCPVLKKQCQSIWGEDSTSSNRACFERLNVLGTPNGNCGSDHRSEIQKCSIDNVYCGSLQCSDGEKAPISGETLPIHFVVYRMNSEGVIHECKAQTLSPNDMKYGLVQDGTKCGYKKLCLNQTCTKIRSIVPGKCPLEELQTTCSGHGICTNKNTCVCEDGWMGHDCSTVDEDWKSGKGSAGYYDSVEESGNKPQYGETELQMNPNLAFTVLVACVIIGLTLVIIVLLFIFYRNLKPSKPPARSKHGTRHCKIRNVDE